MFEKRGENVGIFKVGNAPRSTEIEDGDTVTLLIGAESVHVGEVTTTGKGTYSGNIHGFSPSHAVEFQGLKLGQRVDFSIENVFTCQHLSRP